MYLHQETPPNKTTTEPVSNARTQEGFTEYELKCGPSFNTLMQQVEENDPEPLKQGVFKGKSLKQGTALVLHDWIQIW